MRAAPRGRAGRARLDPAALRVRPSGVPPTTTRPGRRVRAARRAVRAVRPRRASTEAWLQPSCSTCSMSMSQPCSSATCCHRSTTSASSAVSNPTGLRRWITRWSAASLGSSPARPCGVCTSAPALATASLIGDMSGSAGGTGPAQRTALRGKPLLAMIRSKVGWPACGSERAAPCKRSPSWVSNGPSGPRSNGHGSMMRRCRSPTQLASSVISFESSERISSVEVPY